MDSYRFGAGRYIQESNALDYCGEEIKRYGKKAYVIGGNTAIAVTEKRLCSSFEKYGLAYCMERFSGYPSVQKIEGLKAVVKEKDCDVLVGVGGGRIMDLAKAAALELGIPIVAIPTQAATLKQCGYECIEPKGAFYIFVKAPDNNEERFLELARKRHLIFVGGSSFGYSGYVRLSFCCKYEVLQRAADALKQLAYDCKIISMG